MTIADGATVSCDVCTRPHAAYAVPENFLQFAQWQYRALCVEPSISYETPPQRQLPFMIASPMAPTIPFSRAACDLPLNRGPRSR